MTKHSAVSSISLRGRFGWKMAFPARWELRSATFHSAVVSTARGRITASPRLRPRSASGPGETRLRAVGCTGSADRVSSAATRRRGAERLLGDARKHLACPPSGLRALLDHERSDWSSRRRRRTVSTSSGLRVRRSTISPRSRGGRARPRPRGQSWTPFIAAHDRQVVSLADHATLGRAGAARAPDSPLIE